MATDRQPLTVAQILSLKTELETQFQPEDRQIREMRLVREQLDPVAANMTRYTDVEVRDPTITNLISDSVAALSTNPASVTCTYKPNGSEPDEQNATERDAFYTELIEDMSTKIEGLNARVESTDMSLGDGGAWLKVMFYKQLWEEAGARRPRGENEDATEYVTSTENAKKEAGQPFVAIAVDPLTMYPVRSGTKLVVGMEVQKRPLNQTLLQYELEMDPQSGDIIPSNSLAQPDNKWEMMHMNRPQTVDFIECWDAEWCYIIISGGPGKGTFAPGYPWKHGYGRPPYFWAPGYKMGHWKNRKVGWGIAQSLRSLVQNSSFQQTILSDVAARDTYTPVIHVLGETSADIAKLQIKDAKPDWTDDFRPELREVIKAYPGDDFKPFPVRDVAPALTQSIGQTRQMIERALPPKLTSSSGGGMEGAGYAMSQVREEAHQKYHPYIQNLEQMWADILDFVDYLIVNKVKDTVWIHTDPIEDPESETGKRGGGWIGLGPDDITGHPVKKTVSIDPDQATAKLVEGQYWAQQNAAGMADLDTAIRAQGRNPVIVRQGLTKDRIRKSDWYMAWEDEQVTDEMGMGQVLEKSKLAQMVAQTGGLPGAPTQPSAASAPGPQQGAMQTAATGLAASAGAKPPDMAQGMVQGGTTVPTPQNGAAAGIPPGGLGQ